MNSVKNAYNEWSKIYDTNVNPTRDLSHEILKTSSIVFKDKNILELGCGTGTITEILIDGGGKVTAVDFSEGMLSIARKNPKLKNAKFVQGDLNEKWDFGNEKFNLIIVSLVLEHFKDLSLFFKKCKDVLLDDGKIFINELHPEKQISGTQARYYDEEKNEEILVSAYKHSFDDFKESAEKSGFKLESKREEFYEGDKIPRILNLIFAY